MKLKAGRAMDAKLKQRSKPLPGIEAGLKYPVESRKPFFAHWYIRQLMNDQIANQIGIEACWLLTMIAMTEDRIRYTRAVDFYNPQLQMLCGFPYEERLNKVRKKCVEYGLLHYESSSKASSGIYWLLVPHRWHLLWDEYVHTHPLKNSRTMLGESEEESLGKVTVKDGEKCPPSYPIPVPNSSTTAPEPKVVVDEIKILEDKLLSCGVATARETIHKSLSNGATPETITSVIDYFSGRPGAWGPGALVRRLTLGRVQSLLPEQGWPIADSRETELRRSQVVASDRQRSAAEAIATAERKGRETQLELRFGPILDAMPDDKLRELVAQKKPALLKTLQRFGSSSPLVRTSLLGLVAIVAECSR